MKRIYTVLGAGGFIGSHLTRRLLESGHEVVALSRSWGPFSPPPTSSNYSRVTCAFNDESALERVVANSDVVFHLFHGTTPATSMQRVADDVTSAILPSLSIMRMCAEHGVKLVYASSGGTVYGPGAPIPTPEEAPCKPVSSYGASKLAIEHYLSVFRANYGMKYQCLRIANPFGPGQIAGKGQGVIAAWLCALRQGRDIQLVGDGSVVRDYLYIDDLISALVLSASYDGEECVMNVGSGQGRDLKFVAETLARLGGFDLKINFLPNRPLDVPVSVLDIRRAQSALGWKPLVSFEDGLQRTIQNAAKR